MYQIKGKLAVKGDTVKVSDKFTKRTFVLLVEDGKFPQQVELELTQDRVNTIDLFNVGDEIEVGFYIKGRSWTNPQGAVKYFNTLEAFKLTSDSSVFDNVTAGITKGSAISPKASDIAQDDSGLPF